MFRWRGIYFNVDMVQQLQSASTKVVPNISQTYCNRKGQGGQYILSDKLNIFAYRLQYYLRIEETCEQFYTLLFFLCGFFFQKAGKIPSPTTEAPRTFIRED